MSDANVQSDAQFLKTIGDKIRTVRKFRNMGQDELCMKSGVSRPALSLIENGRVNVGIVTVLKLVEALDCEFLCNIKLKEAV